MSNAAKPIELPEDLQAFAEERVRAGEAASVEDVVRDAFNALQERSDDEKLEALRKEAKKGFDQLDAGLGVTRTAAELVARLKERRPKLST
jgi:putative addiction module CopG family antidote